MQYHVYYDTLILHIEISIDLKYTYNKSWNILLVYNSTLSKCLISFSRGYKYTKMEKTRRRPRHNSNSLFVHTDVTEETFSIA